VIPPLKNQIPILGTTEGEETSTKTAEAAATRGTAIAIATVTAEDEVVEQTEKKQSQKYLQMTC
jgi:hypothetical protein